MYGRTSVGLFLALAALLVVLFSAAAVDGANSAVNFNFNFKGLIRTFDASLSRCRLLAGCAQH